MLGNLGNIGNLLKSAKDMQANLAKIQEEMAASRFEGDAGAGLVVATVDGKGALVDIKIDAKAAEDVELLEDLVKGACAAASKKAHEEMRTRMAELTGGLNIPGLGDMLGGGS